MQQYKKQINESFFNPLLHFIPLLLFILIDDNFGSSAALISVYVIVVATLLYSYLMYVNIYKYLGVSYLVTSIIIAAIIFTPVNIFPVSTQSVVSEYIILFSLIIILFLRKRITNFVFSKTPKHLAMTNNLDEHFRIVWILAIVLAVFTTVYTVAATFFTPGLIFFKFSRQVFLALLFFLVFYEFIRVTLIRIRLLKEEWWPIVNENGIVIGSVQKEESLSGSKKYLHPIIRVLLINDSKIFLQKRPSSDVLSPDLWDIALSNHILLNESVEECVERTSYENYKVKNINPILLSKHINQSINENQFVYLFLVCKLQIVEINQKITEHVKWWTIQQIEENLNSGIFCNNFVNEYHILKRSGLLENGTYNCTCKLKEVIYQGINK